MQHHFQFKVDFEPSPDLEDAGAKQVALLRGLSGGSLACEEFQERALAALKLRRAASEQRRAETAERLRAARRARYEALLGEVSAGSKEGGAVEIGLRLPDGSQVKGRFEEGAKVKVLLFKALDSDWARAALPWGVFLRMAYPRKVHPSR